MKSAPIADRLALLYHVCMIQIQCHFTSHILPWANYANLTGANKTWQGSSCKWIIEGYNGQEGFL